MVGVCRTCGLSHQPLNAAGDCYGCEQEARRLLKPRRPRRGVLRKRCDQDGFHEAHEWVHEFIDPARIHAGTLTVTTKLWCSGGSFTGPDEIEDYLGRPWTIGDVENYLAS